MIKCRGINLSKTNYVTTIERRKIRLLQQIPNYDYTSNLRNARNLRCEGTCHWVLNRLEFRGWIDQKDLKHLWCYGIRMWLLIVVTILYTMLTFYWFKAGCGKTVLMYEAL